MLLTLKNSIVTVITLSDLEVTKLCHDTSSFVSILTRLFCYKYIQLRTAETKTHKLSCLFLYKPLFQIPFKKILEEEK